LAAPSNSHERSRRIARRLLVWMTRGSSVVLHVLTAAVALMILIGILRFLLS